MPPKDLPVDANQRTLFGFFKKPESGSSSQSARPSASSSKPKPQPQPKPKPIAVLDSDDVDPDLSLASTSSSVPRSRTAPSRSTPPTSEPPAATQNAMDEDEPSISRNLGKVKRKTIIPDDSTDDEQPAPSSEPSLKKAKLSNGKSKAVPPKPAKKSKDADDFIVPDDEDEFDNMSDAIQMSEAEMDALEELALAKDKAPKPAKSQPSKAVKAPTMQKKLSESSSSSATATKRLENGRKDLESKKKAANADVFEFLRKVRDAEKHEIGHPDYDPRTLHIPQSAWSKMTPFEKQFWEIKRNHYDTVLFFQKGKFYELYEDDATIGHQVFDLKLTDRVKMRMVGVPEASFEYWANKFLAQGYKVGRVAQSETALGAEMRRDAGKGGAKEDKIVQRELKSVYTQATLTEGLVEDMGSHCISIKERTANSHAPPSFALCVLDAATAQFDLSAFDDDISRTKLGTILRQLRPKEIIHEKGNLSQVTLRNIKNILSQDCRWTSLRPGVEFLTPDDALLAVAKFSKEDTDEDSMDVDDTAKLPPAVQQLKGNPTAMSALGGMLFYLKSLNLDAEICKVGNFNIYDMHKAGQTMILDGFTLQHIEVLQNSMGTDEGTLHKLLNRCSTPSGKRLFKIWLCQPLCDAAAINSRLDAVEDLMDNAAVRDAFASCNNNSLDLERLLSRISAGSLKASQFQKVLKGLRALDTLFETLSDLTGDLKSTALKALILNTPRVGKKVKKIEKQFTEDEGVLVPLEEADEEYDAAVKQVEEIEEKLHTTLQGYKEQLDVKHCEFKDVGTKAIYQVEVDKNVKVPDDWTRTSNTTKVNRYYTPKIEKLVRKLKEARETRTTLRNGFQAKLYAAFSQDYRLYLSAVKSCAELDCLLSLSIASSNLAEPAVRPEIVEADEAFVDFQELRHPCLIDVDFISNDVALGGGSTKIMLATGPNMSGKSTLLRMTSAAVIMAQLGCYVPASKARLSPIDRICTRMGANDMIFANASTFKVEMDDCKKILTEATSKSLVVLDELGRGTSTFDGLAIAFAVLQDLATYKNCIAFFSTHYNSLVDDFAYHTQIRACHMSSIVREGQMTFLYKLVDGATLKSYGPAVAKLAGVPDLIVDRAENLSADFEKDTKERQLRVKKDEVSLPLPLQHDLAFLAKVARNDPSIDLGRLFASLSVIRNNVRKMGLQS